MLLQKSFMTTYKKRCKHIQGSNQEKLGPGESENGEGDESHTEDASDAFLYTSAFQLKYS